MNTLEKILSALSKTMKNPTNYDWFHLTFVFLVVLITALTCIFFKNANKKTFNRILFITWITIFVLETYKQIIFSWSYNGASQWDYQWYAFPFQLCSSPLYLLPFAVFLKDGKLKDSVLAFLMTFSFFGGFVVFVYPNDVFGSAIIGINIQTMIHHGSQIFIGIYIAVYNRKRLNLKFFLKAIPVFAVMTLIALGMNLLIPKFTSETFNMFYVGPKYPCTLVVLDSIYANVPYLAFLMIYVVGFSFIALLFYYIFYLSTRPLVKYENKK